MNNDSNREVTGNIVPENTNNDLVNKPLNVSSENQINSIPTDNTLNDLQSSANITEQVENSQPEILFQENTYLNNDQLNTNDFNPVQSIQPEVNDPFITNTQSLNLNQDNKQNVKQKKKGNNVLLILLIIILLAAIGYGVYYLNLN